ncbi:MAG TPA: HAD-IIIA family hydrolase, partial [Candidatus Eisenbacteria bacterium]|nr:HAD-IIIA family hydrolase [Candidatus Eisenbacteria bacterium]
ISAGVYVLDRQLIAAVPEARKVSLERDCFPHWLGKGLDGFRGGTRFLDIGTPESFGQAQVFFAASREIAANGATRPYVLLDRDGTINVERDYLSHPDQLELLPGAIAGMKKLRAMGLGIAILSNQSGVGRGYFDLAQLERVHNRLRAMLGDADLAVDGIYHCPHLPEAACGCRKPETGMVARAAADLGFDPRRSFVVGDKRCDIDLGTRMGATTLLVRTGYGRQSAADGVRADSIVQDLDEAAEVIAAALQRKSNVQTASRN